MLQKIKSYFYKNYFDKSLPFDYRLYMLFFFITFGISIISATTNTFLGAGLLGVIIQHAYNLCCIVILFIPKQKRMQLYRPYLILTTHAYLPFMFFQTAGYEGTSLLFVPLGLFMLCIVFSKGIRKLLIVTCILIFVFISLLEYSFPHLINPFQGPQAKLIDLLVAMLVTFFGMSLMSIYVSRSYQRETDQIESLVKELEAKNKKLEESSIRDALTGVYNRRFLSEFLQRELKSCADTGSHIFLIMMDIDFFKKVNDKFGHGTGDEVLKIFAKTTQDSLRPSDVVARYGGEEFVAILHIENPNDAFTITERIRLAVQSLKFRYDLKITASFGLVKSTSKDTDASLLERADTCLYQAKQTGRNKTVAESICAGVLFFKQALVYIPIFHFLMKLF